MIRYFEGRERGINGSLGTADGSAPLAPNTRGMGDIQSSRAGTEDSPRQKSIFVTLKDEFRRVSLYSVKQSTPIRNVLAAFSVRRDAFDESGTLVPLKHFRFTHGRTEILPDSGDTVMALGIQDGDAIHVAGRAMGTTVTKNSIQTMFAMDSSDNNPSFKPNVRIVETLEVKYRNKWTVCTEVFGWLRHCAPSHSSVSFHNTQVDFV